MDSHQADTLCQIPFSRISNIPYYYIYVCFFFRSLLILLPGSFSGVRLLPLLLRRAIPSVHSSTTAVIRSRRIGRAGSSVMTVMRPETSPCSCSEGSTVA